MAMLATEPGLARRPRQMAGAISLEQLKLPSVDRMAVKRTLQEVSRSTHVMLEGIAAQMRQGTAVQSQVSQEQTQQVGKEPKAASEPIIAAPTVETVASRPADRETRDAVGASTAGATSSLRNRFVKI